MDNNLGQSHYLPAGDDFKFGRLSQLEHHFRKIPWEAVSSSSGVVLRQSVWFTEGKCKCGYKYGNSKKKWSPNRFPDWLSLIARKLEESMELPKFYFNSCNGNLYQLPNQMLEFHKDNEALFREADSPKSKRNVVIASVSYGATRVFFLRKCYDATNEDLPVLLYDGDAITMEGLLQDNYQHCAGNEQSTLKITGQASASASSNSATLGRYNFTFRHIFRHDANCPAR